MKNENIPTVKPVSTKAVFLAQDVANSFEQAIKDQHTKNWQAYLANQQGKKTSFSIK